MFGAAKRIEPEAAPFTVNDVLDAYLKEKRNPFADRICLTADSIEHHLKPIRELWGAMTVDEFADKCRQRVKDQVIEWRKQGWELNTCRTRLSKLRTAFNYAVNEELIDKAPIFKLPPSGPPRERAIDPKNELPALLRAMEAPETPAHIRLAVNLLIRLGCRKGALLQLRWEHVDFEQRVIRLRETQDAITRATNKKRRGDSPMDDELYDILWAAKQVARSTHVIEFRGEPVASIYGGVKALYKRAGIENMHTHDLRRSSATLVYNATGSMDTAASHIEDTKEQAERTYVQKAVETKLPGIRAISEVIAKARNSG